MPRSERSRIIFKGGIGSNDAWAGIGQVNSGVLTGVVSNANVSSGRPILITPFITSSPSLIGSGQNFVLAYDQRSVVTGTSFCVAALLVTSMGSAVVNTAPIGFSYMIFKN